MKLKWLILFLFFSLQGFSQENGKLIWITIDGLRWQELFGGADSLLIGNKEFVSNPGGLAAEFWKDTKKERRETLFPFFWDVAVKEGIMLGNRWNKSKVDLTNTVVMSYAGYSEILTGYADDERIIDNSKIYNPNQTLPEVLNRDPEFKDKIGLFGSWDIFPYIFSEQRSALFINAGYRNSLRTEPSSAEILLGKIQQETPRRWETVRFDTFTHNFALEYLKTEKPRLLYIGYGETDDFAHEGRYDHYLKSARKNDDMIRELWEYVQRDPFYKDQTTFIITTDHGRGESATEKSTWKHHGPSIENSGQTWIVAFGKGISKEGEQSKERQYYTNQIAATVARILGFEYTGNGKAGKPLDVLSE
ncbi:alkaline phosphatase family protein [Salinimicrobium flavum]|uniref:Alkaline phosphatase family protein n=1 Tax=Salinimicrobium flavum TaxID=1737065 RepID=A0ABW5IU78_9FLAO